MGKIRINKLALELNVPNDQIIDELRKKDYPVKNHMSSIDEEMANYIRDKFTVKTAKKAVKKASVKTKKAKAVVHKPITAKTAAKVAAKKKATAKKKVEKAEEETAKAAPATAKEGAKPAKLSVVKKAKSAKKPKAVSGTKSATAKKSSKAVVEETSKTPRKLGLKVVKAEEAEKETQGKKPKAPEKLRKKPVSPEPAKVQTPEPQVAPTPLKEEKEEGFEVVQLSDNMPLRELAEKLKCSPNDLIKDLMGMGILATINQSLEIGVSSKIADKRGFEVEVVVPKSGLEFEEEEEEDRPQDRVPRPPIITIMGHVDHGKTSLLDAIRKTNITESEKGGITQHIGAYQVKIKNSSITFLDTPGHEAFTAMRARGAKVTDVVVLVVAADDGIKPQTKEALDHANAANVPIVVAINKIDKPDAKPEEVKKQLADLGLLPEDWGGQTIFTEVSALTGAGIDNLLELLLLQAEIMELKGNPKLRARGIVIESKLDKGRGPVATVIIQQGTLHVGDPFIVGNYFGKVRALVNDQGRNIAKASLSMPVEVVGLPEVPNPGDAFIVVKDEKKARQLSDLRIQKQREIALSQKPRITMEDLHKEIVDGKIYELNLIIKADVQGSIQAVKDAMAKLETDKIRIKVIHDDVGGITESDVLLASASNAIIIGFNVRPTDKAGQMAAQEKVDVRLYSVIYDAINDIKKAMEGMLEPTFKEKILGRVEVRQVFNIPKVGVIAGCFVQSGVVERNRQARLIRDNVVIHDGKITSLKRFKDDVKEVAAGYECGLAFEKFQDLKQGDIVEPYVLEKVTADIA